MPDATSTKVNPNPVPSQTDQDVDTSPHRLVQKLLGESEPPADVVPLVGYFGKSKKSGYVRLYFTLDFGTYCEISDPSQGGQGQAGGGVIVYAAAVDPNDPDSPTLVFVKSDAALEFHQTSKTTVQASFLSGAIASANLGASTPTALGKAGPFFGVGISSPYACAVVCTLLLCKIFTHFFDEYLAVCTQGLCKPTKPAPEPVQGYPPAGCTLAPCTTTHQQKPVPYPQEGDSLEVCTLAPCNTTHQVPTAS